MNFKDFTAMVINLYTTSTKYSIEFTLYNDNGGSTFEINSISDFGLFLANDISEWRLLNDEYKIHNINIKDND